MADKMTAEQIRGFCQNNGVNCSPVGAPLRVMDITELPASIREQLNSDGTYKGEDTSVETAKDTGGAVGEENANPEAVRKTASDTTLEDVEAREAALEEEGETEDLSSLTVAELKDKARDLEVAGFSTMHKDELVKAIKKAEK